MNDTILLPESHAECLKTYVRESLFDPLGDIVSLKMLAGELERSRIVPDEDFPPDVVTLGKAIAVEYLDTGEVLNFVLAKPGGSLAEDPNNLSVLSPLGLAVLGTRVAACIEWPLTRGALKIRVQGVGGLHPPDMMSREMLRHT